MSKPSAKSAMLKPQLGAKLQYLAVNHPPQLAFVTLVHHDREVNLAIFNEYGTHQGGKVRVPLWQPDEEKPGMPYAAFLPADVLAVIEQVQQDLQRRGLSVTNGVSPLPDPA